MTYVFAFLIVFMPGSLRHDAISSPGATASATCLSVYPKGKIAFHPPVIITTADGERYFTVYVWQCLRPVKTTEPPSADTAAYFARSLPHSATSQPTTITTAVPMACGSFSRIPGSK